MKEISTQRLILRKFKETDLNDLFEFLLQLKDNEFEGYPDITYENCKKHLDERVGSNEYYAVALKDGGKVIGNIYCGEREYDAREAGYIINENYRQKGYGCEALKAVTEYLLSSGTHRVYAECDPENECSWRLLEKAGSAREAHLKQNIYFRKTADGRPVRKDTYIYAVTE